MGVYLWTEQTIYDGMLGWRPLQSDLLDVSGNNNTLTKTGCSFGTVGDKAAIRLQTSFSNSPSNYITTPSLGNPTTYSFAGWLYKTNGDTSGSKDWQSFWENANADTIYALRLRAKYNKLRLCSYGDLAVTDDTVYAIPQNTWIQVGVTSDGSVMKLYINGELYYTGVGQTTKTNANTTYSIGRGYSNGSNWRGWCGWVRQFAFWDRVLSDNEIQSFYNQTT